MQNVPGPNLQTHQSLLLQVRSKWKSHNLFSAGFPTDQRNGDKEFVIRRAATNRVLNVLRHWVSKHSPVNCHLHQHEASITGTVPTVHMLTQSENSADHKAAAESLKCVLYVSIFRYCICDAGTEEWLSGSLVPFSEHCMLAVCPCPGLWDK